MKSKNFFGHINMKQPSVQQHFSDRQSVEPYMLGQFRS